MANKTLYIPEGIPNIQSMFPAIDFNNVEEYFITVYDSYSGAFSNGFSNGFAVGTEGASIATTRINKLDCCCTDDKVRIHFINSLGEIDSINFSRAEELEEIKLNHDFRRNLLHAYETYYALHIQDFGTLKSLPVLREILN